MAEALKLADYAATQGEVPVGCVIVFEDRIIGRGYNLRESNQDPIAHAEILAISEAAKAMGSWRLEDCTLYVTLEPCPMCAGALVLSRIARCVYGCTDPKAGFVGTLADISQFPGLNHHYPVTGGVCEEACRSRLQDFFRAVRANKKLRRDGRVV
ncbi:MAG: tRNA-specific adenosine deaminase [Rhodobacterales bacterium]|nr:tRNA-specific adenosine deaminase [Rhodobacterales bacterium]